ncbi:redoxin domain-containing protein [Flavobacterium sp. 83]|jgi:thiol-disulfide isomerase/thioredoxin|uniref:TlpA family protein disulfide reductase n=1 Tax=Flavobacterium sp. 83 TaxID=1131812 RepID=UPI00055550FB|nr:redoxin domain-containing protein [Flavobacterium sp. 83]
MKKYYLLFLLIVSCQKSSNKFNTPYSINVTVKFNISKIPDGEVFYLHKLLLDYTAIVIDSCVKRNNLLRFKTKTKESFIGIIKNKNNSVQFIATNDSIYIVWNDWDEITKKRIIVNGGENDFFEKNHSKYVFPYNRNLNVNLQISKYGIVNSRDKDYLYLANYEKQFYNWINENSDKYYSTIKLYENSRNLSNNTLLKCLESLRENFKNTFVYNTLQEYFKNRKNSQIGERFMDFKVINSGQKTVKSESIFESNKEKYVLDFGASWCKYCIIQAREINKNYSKIDTSKIQIISLSIDEDKDRWLLYHKKENYKWKGFLINKNKGNDNIRSIISTIPAYFVLDKDKKIIGKYDALDSIPFLKLPKTTL